MISEYELKYSARRTLALEIGRDAKLIVRAPYGVSKKEIERFIDEHADWVEKKLGAAQVRHDAFAKLNDAEIDGLKAKAKEILFPMTARYAAVLGLSPSSIRITSAKTRYGSCGRNGNICYSWRLMLSPPAAYDYVVVHELCHMRHFDHSKRFYALLESVLPDYKARRALLKCVD